MALRDKLTERVAPLLQPGEQVRHVFLAQAGANPWLGNSFGLLLQGMVKRRVVAVTDQNVVVLGATFNGTKPTQVLHRLPRATPIGPTKGIWSRIQLGGDTMWVHAKFRKEIAAADAGVAG